jgi:hypothetical protein
MESTRTCRRCEVPLTSENTYDRRRVCKECHKTEAKANKRKTPDIRARTCEKCRVFRPAEKFRTRRGYCVECLGQPDKGVDAHRCRGCREWKDPGEFLTLAKSARCTECRARRSKRAGNQGPSARVSVLKRICSRCRQRKGNPHFAYNPETRRYSTVCEDCRGVVLTFPCSECGEVKARGDYSDHNWRRRHRRPPSCLACQPLKLYMTEHHDYEYRFARDVAGMSHAEALDWMQGSYGGLIESYYARYGWLDNPKPYKPYEPDPLDEPERELIEYTDLDSRVAQGTVWCEGPKDKTVWVIRGDGECVVVNPTKGIEVAYDWPRYVEPIPAEILQMAKDVLEGYAQAQKDLEGLGFIKPIGQDYTVAATLLARHRQHQRSRQVYIDGHSARASISTKRLRELAKEDIEVNP